MPKTSPAFVERVAIETQRKEDLTLDELIHAMQDAWTRFRNAQLYAFCAGAPVLTWARANEHAFYTHCRGKEIVGDTHETRVVELMLAGDGDGEAISRERRAEYAACIGWFADNELCPETDPNKAVALARKKGRITGIAQEYRGKKDAENPRAKAAKLKGQVTKKARRQGSENNVSQAASAAADAASLMQVRSRRPGRGLKQTT